MLLMSTSFLLMPAASERALNGEGRWLMMTGFLFWLPLIASYLLLFFANRCRRNQVGRDRPRGVKTWGLFRFFSNPWAVASDIIFVIGLAGFLWFLFRAQERYATYIFLFAAVTALPLHGVFNGVNFRYIRYGEKVNPKIKEGGSQRWQE
jgi:hypothetical protein